MNSMFSDRISDVPRSFIREILKVAIDPSVISFAGGLPNRNLFPLEELREATNKVFDSAGRDALQYSNSEGNLQLREYISARYREKQDLDVPVDNILIINGSQQGLDLLGKIFLNEGDEIIVEEPGYLGAIQAFCVYRSTFRPIPLTGGGMNVDRLREVMAAGAPKLIYTVPNFQNPSGNSYPEENRCDIANVVRGTRTLLIEDDPYGELRFAGTPKRSFWELLPDNTVLLGSFSKVVAPGLRIGWIVARDHVMEKLLVAKQASDLHSNHLVQRILQQFLEDHDLDDHIGKIVQVYDRQRLAMLQCIADYLPVEVVHTTPEGGMFLWLALPEGASSMELFDLAIKERVAFVPGDPFYVDGRKSNTLRLNFSCVDEKTIETGMKRLGGAVDRLLSRSGVQGGSLHGLNGSFSPNNAERKVG